MINLEDRVRLNLKRAGNALVVPQPRRQHVTTTPSVWKRPMRIVVASALATLVLIALPVILVNPGDQGSGPSSPVVEPSTTTIGTVPPTTEPTLLVGLKDVSTERAQYLLWARESDVEEDPPTASIVLWANTPDGSEQIDQVLVGEADSFFYNSVIDVDGLCPFYAPEPDRVVVQVRLSASMGCSQPYVFELREGSLVEVEASAEEISHLFVTAWEAGDEATMAGLVSDPEVVQQAFSIAPTLTDPTLKTCEGAAGSIYCTYETADESVVIRVQNVEPPRTVTGVQTGETSSNG